LIEALADRFQGKVPVIKEVARHVMQEKGYTREDVDSPNRERRFSLQRDIFTAQIEMENSLLESEWTSSFLSDRSAIDPIVYLTHFAGPDESLRITSTTEWKIIRGRYADAQKFLVVLLSPVPEFLVDDNTRYMAKSLEDWHSLTNSFRGFLDAQRIPFIEIGEDCVDLKERVTLVLNQLASQERDGCRLGVDGHD